MTIPPISLGITKGAEWLNALNAEMFTYGQAHGYMNKNAEHTSVHALAGRLQAGPNGNLELTVPSSLIKGVFDALDEPGAEFVVRNNRTESAIKVMTKEEVDKLGGVSHISERGHSYHYTLGPIVELPATGDYDKLWAISIKSNDLEDIRKSYGLETSPQLGFYIPVGCKKSKVTEDNAVSKLAGAAEDPMHVYSYIPSGSIKHVKEHGLLSGNELAKPENRHLLDIARPNGDADRWLKEREEKLIKSPWANTYNGPSVLFGGIDTDKINDMHPINKFNTTRAKINLHALLKDYPATKMEGSELIPFSNETYDALDEKGQNEFINKRHHTLSPEEIKALITRGQNPKDMWKDFKDTEGKYYASDVPHAKVVTPMGKIPSKYIEFDEELPVSKLASMLENVREVNMGLGDDLESIRRSYGLETSPQLGFYIPVGCKKKRVTESNDVSKLASVHEYAANDPNMRILSQGPVTDRDFLYHASGKKFDLLDPSYNSKKSFGHEYNAPVVFAGDSPSSAFAANPTAEYQAVKDKIKNSVYHRLINEQTGRKALLGHTSGGYLYKLPASAFTKIDREDNELGKWNKSTEYVSHMPVKPISVTPMQSTDVDAIPEYEYLGEDFVGEMPAQHYLNHAKDPKVIAAVKAWLGNKAELTKESVYWSDDVSRDLLNGRKYPVSYLTGELGELGTAIKNRDWPNFKEEVGDSAYAAQMLLAQRLGLNLPLIGASGPIDKFYARRTGWHDIFKGRGVPFSNDYLAGGSNLKKPKKIQAALGLAGHQISNDDARALALKHGGEIEDDWPSTAAPPEPALNKLAWLLKRAEGEATPSTPPIEPISLPSHSPPSGMPAPSIPQGTDFNAMWDKWKKVAPNEEVNYARRPVAMRFGSEALGDPQMPVNTSPSGAKQLGTVNFGNMYHTDTDYSRPNYIPAKKISPGVDSGPGVFRVSAHGGGERGNYDLSNSGNKPIGIGDGRVTSGMPHSMFNQNPSTVISQACNAEGGCTPATYGNMFKSLNPTNTKSNLDKVVMTPPGFYASGTNPQHPLSFLGERGSAGWPGQHDANDAPYKGNISAYHEYRLPKGGDPSNEAHWTDTGVYNDARQEGLPLIGLGGEALEMARHFNLPPELGGGNFNSYLDKTRRITSNPDASYPERVRSSWARHIGSAAELARSGSEIAGSIPWNNHLAGMNKRVRDKMNNTPPVHGLYPGVPIN